MACQCFRRSRTTFNWGYLLISFNVLQLAELDEDCYCAVSQSLFPNLIEEEMKISTTLWVPKPDSHIFVEYTFFRDKSQ